MTESSEATNQAGRADRPISEWDDAELASAWRALPKEILEWTQKDWDVKYERLKRRRVAASQRLDRLKKQEDFSIEDWIHYLAEIVAEIYDLALFEDYIHDMHALGFARIRDDLRGVAAIADSSRRPPPGYFGPNLGGIEMKLDAILELLGGPPRRFG